MIRMFQRTVTMVVLLGVLASISVYGQPPLGQPESASQTEVNGIVITMGPNLTPNYSSDECSVSWHRMTDNRGAYFYVTLNTNNPDYSTNSGIWRPSLPTTGQYLVEMYNPSYSKFRWPCPPPNNDWVGPGSSRPPTGDARYRVYHATGNTAATRSQNPANNQWINLGTYVFYAGTSGYVRLTDLNGEANWGRAITFGSARFTYVGSIISGVVRDGSDNPVPNIAVYLEGRGTATTDSNGRYMFTGLSTGEGTYVVRTPDGSAYQLYPYARVVQVPAENSVTNVDFTLVPVYGELTGIVTDSSSGNPIVNATASAGGRTARTNSEGIFSLLLLPGTYKLSVSASGYDTYNRNFTIQGEEDISYAISLQRSASTGYYLPYPGGVSHQCTQGNSQGSHTDRGNKYAYDFGQLTAQGTRDSTLVASRAGRVTVVRTGRTHCGTYPYCSAACRNNGGNYVRILHSDGSSTYYFHMSKIYVHLNQWVSRGQVIGRSGETGCTRGAHVHFVRRSSSGASRQTRFADVSSNNGIPRTGRWYTSGNYRSFRMVEEEIAAGLDSMDVMPDTEPPWAEVHLRTTGQLTLSLQIWAADYVTDAIDVHLAATAADLQAAPWISYTEAVNNYDWPAFAVYAQFRDANGNLTDVITDTLEATVYEPLQAAFAISPTVCMGEPLSIMNQTIPYCEQCSWLWDFGNGIVDHGIEPQLYYEDSPYSGYFEPGVHTIHLTVTNMIGSGTASHQVEVLPVPDAEFTVLRAGNTITVEAAETGAIDWIWDFGDEITGTGRIATHTYTDTTMIYPVALQVIGSNGCYNYGYWSVDFSNYLPLVLREH